MIINNRLPPLLTITPVSLGIGQKAHVAQGGGDFATEGFDVFDEGFGVEVGEIGGTDEGLEGYAAEVGHAWEEGVEECGAAGLVEVSTCSIDR